MPTCTRHKCGNLASNRVPVKRDGGMVFLAKLLLVVFGGSRTKLIVLDPPSTTKKSLARNTLPVIHVTPAPLYLQGCHT